MLLRHLLEQGQTKTAIARELGLSRRTVHHWITTGQLDRDVAAGSVHYAPRPLVLGKLDPYKPLIAARLAEFPDLSAVRLYAEARAAGYTGRITRLRDYVAAVRPRPVAEPVVRFETPPGHQAQVDFARVAPPWGVRYALVVVLGYSRQLWLRFGLRQDWVTLTSGLEAAFTAFGGVPRELLFDQMRAVITRDDRLAGGTLLGNAEFARFAAHWGFRPRVCRPYRAQTKGKVERPIRYLRTGFLYGRTFAGDADLQAQAEHWLETVANQRVHATTGEPPSARFARDERATLLPLAGLAVPPGGAGHGSRCPLGVPVPRGRTHRRAPAAHDVRTLGGRRVMTPAIPSAMPSLRDRVRAQLADLKMPGALEALDGVLAALDGGTVRPADAIEQLLGAQITLRNNRRLDAAMRSSRLPIVKTLAGFDFGFQPSLKREQVESLHTLGFVERKENVILLGGPAWGKRTWPSASPSPRLRAAGACTTAPWPISSRRSKKPRRRAGSRSG